MVVHRGERVADPGDRVRDPVEVEQGGERVGRGHADMLPGGVGLAGQPVRSPVTGDSVAVDVRVPGDAARCETRPGG